MRRALFPSLEKALEFRGEFPDRSGAINSTYWTVKDAEKLYNMAGWGQGFFRINARGHVTVHPDGNPKRGLDLYQLALDLNAQGVGLPLLLRFSDILRARIQTLSTQFANAIGEFGYEGRYTTVYPVKVNQQRHIVQEVVEFGAPVGVGLECGSKPELMAVLGLNESTSHIIVCNGYKDEEYMRLALMGQKLGHTVFIVLEQFAEVETLLRVAGEMGVTPTVGVRIKLATEGSGRWAKSGGERSKFGLSAAQLVKLLDRLTEAGRKDVLKLVHFHLGSQITDITYIKAGLEEIARYYVELRELGFDITHVDVGGGLGVDYDGSRSTRAASMNYSIREYANDVVYTLGTVCRAEGLPMPHIISESGRAITAHHSLLLINVTDVESQFDSVPPVARPDAHPLLVEMAENLESLTPERIQEVYHDAVFAKNRAQELFASGVLSLRDRAEAESYFLTTVNAVARLIGDDKSSYPDIAADIEGTLVDRYFCNFSVFQSLPDSWAIDQLFPIMPIHRLDEQPTRRGTLQDMTCDSDGVIDRFVGGRKGKPSLELHPFNHGEPYILGIFLTGAYQEILGDLHNLFGDTNAVHVRLTESGYEITDLVHGDTVTEVLNYVQFHASDLLATFRRKVTNARGLTRTEANRFIADYVAGLEGYTYLEGDIPVEAASEPAPSQEQEAASGRA
ncbi:MAG TPA: biosynthetic arginine decarboxylase [Gemmatimonadales bacterium]|nr:biosynthetic arginine decarboxylase [Gemmatimonadales bacterium]